MPPWNDSSKNLVRDLAGHLESHQAQVLIRRGQQELPGRAEGRAPIELFASTPLVGPANPLNGEDVGTDAHPTLTIGNDVDTGAKIEAMGSKHQAAVVTDAVVDAPNKIVSTPAYMLGQSISEVAEGIEKTVAELVKML